MDDIEAFFGGIVEEDPLLSWIDAEVAEVGDGRLALRVPASERIQLASSFEGTGGTAHAGVIATLVDVVGGAARTRLEDGERAVLATTDMNVSYLRPATGALVATGEVVRVGSTSAVVDVTVESTTPRGEREPVAVGRATYRVLYPDE